MSSIQALRKLPYEPFLVEHLTDRQRRYQLQLNPAFPFAVKSFDYDALSEPYPLNWHERLELFVPVQGEGEFRMGERVTPFEPGDILVVDNLRLHGVERFAPSKRRRAVVITFLPEFVYTLGAPVCDSLFLSAFFAASEAQPRVGLADAASTPLHQALGQLVECYYTAADPLEQQAGSKALLLQVLFHLRKHFGWNQETRAEYFRRREHSQSLSALDAHLRANFAERITVASAAAFAGMSETKFMKQFKSATGETFVSYLRRLRMERALQLLEETGLTVAEVAAEVGFADQSYFDKVFRGFFGRTPSSFRLAARGLRAAG